LVRTKGLAAFVVNPETQPELFGAVKKLLRTIFQVADEKAEEVDIPVEVVYNRLLLCMISAIIEISHEAFNKMALTYAMREGLDRKTKA